MRPSSYVWKSSTEPLSIDLALDVVQRLGLAAMEAFKAVPRRGLEIGGILLGRSETRHGATAIHVRDFEPLESEHRSGPSYRLSESDLQHLDEALGRHSDAVGIYRTQTRSDSLVAEEDDATLFSRCFTIPGRLFLLIQPVSGRAAFFLSRGGTLAPVHEFPFRLADLAAGAAPVPHAPVVTRNRRWLIPVVAGGLGVIAGAGVLRFEYRPAVVPAAPHQPEQVTLEVRRDGNALRFLWDRKSPTIRNADHAILYIIDGNRKSQLNLDASELTTGLLSYWPETGDVTFRLETFAGGRSSIDSIRAVGAGPVPAIAVAAVAPVPPLATADREKPAAVSKPKPVKSRNTALEEKSEDVATAGRRPSPFDAPERPKPGQGTAPPHRAPAAEAPATAALLPKNSTPATQPVLPPIHTARREPEPYVSVAAEPVQSSRLGRVIGKIPLLRRLRKQPQHYVPPEPVHQAQPVLTAAERRAVTHSVPIDVKVYVTDAGKVDYAELLTDDTSANRELASAAVYAARQWQFTPARLGGGTVPGEVILHFRFRPAELSAVQ